MAEATAAVASTAGAGDSGTAATQQDNAAAGAKTGETAAQAEARRLKLRIDNQDVELDESEVVANYRKGRDASKLLTKVEQRRQEALKARAEAEGLLGRLKSDPRGVLRELGVDVRGLSEKTILEEMELEKMTPAERRAYEAEQKLKAYEAEKEKAKQTEAEKAHAAEVERHKDELAGLFLETFDKLGLPKSSARFVLHRMAHLYGQNEAAGLESTPEEMAAYVLEGFKGEHKGVLSGLEGEALLSHLGEDMVKKVLSAHLSKVRAKRGMGGQQVARQALEAVAKPAEGFDRRKGRMGAIEKMLREP